MTAFASRSARVPARNYKRRLSVSKHAVERFRERVDEEFRHRDDEDLSNLLDERISHAEVNYQVRDPRAPDDITTLRSVACRHATYYAVVRNNTVVTLLDEDMARNNFDGQWKPVLNAPFTVLRDMKIPPSLPALPAPQLPATPEDPTADLRPIDADMPATASGDSVLAGEDRPAEAAAASAPAVSDSLAEAGVAYAQARRQRHACEETVAALKLRLDRATEALLAAELAVEDTHRRLIELAEKEEA